MPQHHDGVKVKGTHLYIHATLFTTNLTPPPSMGHFTYSDGIAVWKLVFFSPALLISGFVAARHGFAKSSGWIYLTIFCIIRIVGSAAQLALISNPTSDGARTTALICSILGLSPLLLSSLGLLARSYVLYHMLRWSQANHFADSTRYSSSHGTLYSRLLSFESSKLPRR